MKKAFALVCVLATGTIMSGCSPVARPPIVCTNADLVVGATRTPYNGYNLAPITATAGYTLGPGVSYKGTSIALYDETLKRDLGDSPADGDPAKISMPEGHTIRFRVIAVATNGDYSPCGPEKTLTIPVVAASS